MASTLYDKHSASPCPYCQETMTFPRLPTRDHIRPRRAGFRLEEWNAIVVCVTCNGDKGDMTLRDFVLWLEKHGDARAPIVKALLVNGLDKLDPKYGDDTMRRKFGLVPVAEAAKRQWDQP